LPIQRVVRTPEKWLRIVEVAKELGRRLPPVPDSKALSDFLAKERRRDPEVFPDLSVTVVKLIGSGEYVMIPPGKSQLGHFGLAVSDYTHSTAPNRRYIDLIMQRLLKAILSGKNLPYNKVELAQIAEWCTTRDHAAKKVERFMRKVAGAILLSDRIGEVFEGIVTGASEKGVYVRLFAPPVEGRVVLEEDGLEVGQKVHVRLIRMRPEKGYIDFERTNPPASKRSS
jgi:exoribonuclease-2